jgi:integrase
MAIFKKRGEYWIDYYVQGRRRREKIGPSKKLAQAVMAKRRVQIAEAKYLDMRRMPICKFEELAKEYLEYSRLNKRSYKQSELPNVQKLLNYFRGQNLQQISTLDIERYKAYSRQKHKPATVNRQLACLKHMFNKAIQWGKAKDNPVRSIRFFSENNQRTRYLTDKEYRLLLLYSTEGLKPIIELAVHTGLRHGEICNLKWTDIDFIANLIWLEKSKNNQLSAVPMNQTVKRLFDGLPRCLHTPYVFCGPRKDRLSKNWISRAFRRAAEKAG